MVANAMTYQVIFSSYMCLTKRFMILYSSFGEERFLLLGHSLLFRKWQHALLSLANLARYLFVGASI